MLMYSLVSRLYAPLVAMAERGEGSLKERVEKKLLELLLELVVENLMEIKRTVLLLCYKC